MNVDVLFLKSLISAIKLPVIFDIPAANRVLGSNIILVVRIAAFITPDIGFSSSSRPSTLKNEDSLASPFTILSTGEYICSLKVSIFDLILSTIPLALSEITLEAYPTIPFSLIPAPIVLILLPTLPAAVLIPLPIFSPQV